jgi:hypothetical protein
MKRPKSASERLKWYAQHGHYQPGLSEECWPWRGRIDGHGYGRMGSEMAHRLVYEALRGTIAPGLHIDHTCHTADLDCMGGRRGAEAECRMTPMLWVFLGLVAVLAVTRDIPPTAFRRRSR